MNHEITELVGESNPDQVLISGKEITSLKIEDLKTELDKRGLKKSGGKCTLVVRLRAAIMTERFPLRSEIDSAPAQTERPANTRGKSFISRSSITSVINSFIEAKGKEICCREIETLKSEASTSYASETIISLQNENDMLQQKLKELENRYESVRVEQEFSLTKIKVF